MSWTNEVSLEFLDHYRAEQLLWDPKHPLHRNRCEVNEAWRRIQNNLTVNCSIEDLKKKKESLMTSFRLHFNRKKKCTGEYRTSWFAFSFMESFLAGKYECDSTNEHNLEYLSNEYKNTFYNPQDPVGNTSQNVNTTTDHRRMNRSSCSKPQNNSDYVYKRKLENSYLKNEKCKPENDEYDLYAQLLARKLRKLDEHQRDIAMHEIDNIMFNAKMQSSSVQTSYSTSPSPKPRKIKSPVFIITQQNNDPFEDENNISYQEQP